MLLNQSRSFRFHLTIKRRKRMEYLIVFSVVAMMTLYVLILAICATRSRHNCLFAQSVPRDCASTECRDGGDNSG
jgi:hypothetical protein